MSVESADSNSNQELLSAPSNQHLFKICKEKNHTKHEGLIGNHINSLTLHFVLAILMSNSLQMITYIFTFVMEVVYMKATIHNVGYFEWFELQMPLSRIYARSRFTQKHGM